MNIDKFYTPVMVVATTLLAILSFVVLGSYFYNLVALLGIVLVLTYLLLLPVNWVEKGIQAVSTQWNKTGLFAGLPRANPRILAVLLVYFAFFMVIATASIRIIPVLSEQILDFTQASSRYVAQMSETVVEWSDHYLGRQTVKQIFKKQLEPSHAVSEESATVSLQPVIVPNDPFQRKQHITQQEKQVIQSSLSQTTYDQAILLMAKTINHTLSHSLELLSGTAWGVIYVLSGILLVFYFLLDGARLAEDFARVFPASLKSTVTYFLTSFHQVMYAFVRGQVLLGMVTGTYMFIVYSVFGVPYAIFLGVFMAISECLPVVGTWIGLAPAIVVMLFTFGPVKTLFIWCFSYAYQTIKDNIVAPKIVGEVMGLHPVVVIIALVVCAQLAGLLGVLLALPLASVINVILRYIRDREIEELTQQNGGGL